MPALDEEYPRVVFAVIFRAMGAVRWSTIIASLVVAVAACGSADESISGPTESLCTIPSLTPTPPEIAVEYSLRLNEFCGSVTIDGSPAPDGVTVELYVPSFFGCQIDTPPLAAVETGHGTYGAVVVGSTESGSVGGMPFFGNCAFGVVYFRVAGRWANETVVLAREALTRTLDLTVTTPVKVARPTSLSEPLDPRLFSPSYPPCLANGVDTPSLVLQYFENTNPDLTTRYESDIIGVPYVHVRVPELGLEATTDKYGCLMLNGFDVDEPRLITIVGQKDGYGAHIERNRLLRPEGGGGGGEMRRDGILTVVDDCYFSHPPASAGEMGRVEACRAVGALPPFLARNCEHPGVRRQQAFDPNLRVLVGVVSEAGTGIGIPGATIEIAAYGLSTESVEGGCYNFGEFATNGTELVTLMVSAAGYDQLTIKNFQLGTLGAFDFALRPGNGATIQDYCRLGRPENQTWIGREVLCRNAGLLQWEEMP